MKNNRMLFISSYNSNIVSYNGVAKKLKSEIETFIAFGYDVSYTEISENGVYLFENKDKVRICKWGGTYHNTFKLMYNKLGVKAYDVVYFRYEHISLAMTRYFQKLKKLNHKLIIIGELPTYQKSFYKNSSLNSKIRFIVKRLLNKYLPKNIDYIVTFSEHKRLFGVPTIKIENFVDLKSILIRKSNLNFDTINLLALAQLTDAHGYYLVIRGLADYYKQDKIYKNVYLHIVGDGLIRKRLENLCSELSLMEYVTFHGALGGEKLDNIFEQCNIGIGAIAIFRKGGYKLSELKLREYSARGIPFVYNAYEPQLENIEFCLKIPFTEQPVDINSVVNFSNKLQNINDLHLKIRTFAEKEFSVEKQLCIIHNKITNQ